jgi:uncharacterized protein (UPF0548 family)
MLTVRKPTPELMRRYIAAQSKLKFTYSAVGATATTPPANFLVDHTRVELGQGAALYQQARRALAEWNQFALGWLEAWPTDTPIAAGETVAVVARAFGLWWINAARIVYVVDEKTDAASRFGFAYGTLPGHVEAGEERFLVEWDRATDRVYYDILAFSRPRHYLARINKWQVRRLQKRFAQRSAAAMRAAVRAEDDRQE